MSLIVNQSHASCNKFPTSNFSMSKLMTTVGIVALAVLSATPKTAEARWVVPASSNLDFWTPVDITNDAINGVEIIEKELKLFHPRELRATVDKIQRMIEEIPVLKKLDNKLGTMGGDIHITLSQIEERRFTLKGEVGDFYNVSYSVDRLNVSLDEQVCDMVLILCNISLFPLVKDLSQKASDGKVGRIKFIRNIQRLHKNMEEEYLAILDKAIQNGFLKNVEYRKDDILTRFTKEQIGLQYDKLTERRNR